MVVIEGGGGGPYHSTPRHIDLLLLLWNETRLYLALFPHSAIGSSRCSNNAISGFIHSGRHVAADEECVRSVYEDISVLTTWFIYDL